MKRFALVALLAAMLFGVATMASATELKVKGNLDVYGMWSANLNDFDSEKGDADNYFTNQRMRTFFTYQASENLKAVLGLEIDNTWGEGTAADWGTDGKGNIEVKHAYLDFNFPDSTVNVKAGLQYVALPGIFGNPVFDEDAAALVVSAPINDMFGVAVGYSRGVDKNSNVSTASKSWDATKGEFVSNDFTGSDDIDMAFLAVPVTLDGFSMTPYFAYAWIGEKSGYGDDVTAVSASFEGEDGNIYKISGTSTDAATWTDDATVWALGANAELTMFDPLTIAADLIYGQLDAESEGDNVESDGWYAALAATYKMEMVTPTLFFTYFTGKDEDASDNNQLPQLAEGWGITPYVGGVRAFNVTDDTFSGIDNACWSVGLKLADITFVEKLSHELTLAYVGGTSDEDAADVTFTEEDSAWELFMVNKYMIYENLAAINELGYFAPDFDGDQEDDASYFATVGFSYKF